MSWTPQQVSQCDMRLTVVDDGGGSVGAGSAWSSWRAGSAGGPSLSGSLHKSRQYNKLSSHPRGTLVPYV